MRGFHCEVASCRNRSGSSSNLTFHSIPRVRIRDNELKELSRQRREAWLIAIYGRHATSFVDKHWKRICGQHFHSGHPAKLRDTEDPDWLPSLLLASECEIERRIIRQRDRLRKWALKQGCGINLNETDQAALTTGDASIASEAAAVKMENQVERVEASQSSFETQQTRLSYTADDSNVASVGAGSRNVRTKAEVDMSCEDSDPKYDDRIDAGLSDSESELDSELPLTFCLEPADRSSDGQLAEGSAQPVMLWRPSGIVTLQQATHGEMSGSRDGMMESSSLVRGPSDIERRIVNVNKEDLINSSMECDSIDRNVAYSNYPGLNVAHGSGDIEALEHTPSELSAGLLTLARARMANAASGNTGELRQVPMDANSHLVGPTPAVPGFHVSHSLSDTSEWEEAYECDTCYFRFSNPRGLVVHKCYLEEYPSLYRCTKCDTAYPSVRSLFEHMLIHRVQNTNFYPYKCGTCPRSFSRLQGLTIHKCSSKPVGEVGLYLCVVCGNKCSTSQTLFTHLKKHGVERVKAHECETCTERFEHVSQLAKHNCPNAQFRCDICGKGYHMAVILKFHRENHEREYQRQKLHKFKEQKTTARIKPQPTTGGRVQQLGTGEKKPQQPAEDNLQEEATDKKKSRKPAHVNLARQVTDKNESQHQPFNNSNNQQLTPEKSKPQHQRTDKDNQGQQTTTCTDKCEKQPPSVSRATKMQACKICGIKFATTEELADHQFSHLTIFKCDICSMEFLKEENLKYHKEVHNKVPKVTLEIKCPVCERGFSSQYRMRSHLKQHMEKEHVCEVCGRAFALKHQLNSHMWSHRDETRYECEMCGQGFKYKHTLEQHLLRHTGERPHECHVCGKRFFSTDGLKGHVLSHEGPPPFQCDLCEKGYFSTANLRNHRLDKHGIQKSFKRKR